MPVLLLITWRYLFPCSCPQRQDTEKLLCCNLWGWKKCFIRKAEMSHRGWRPCVVWDSRAAAFMSEKHRVSWLTFLFFPKTFQALGRQEIEGWCHGLSLTSCRLPPPLTLLWVKKKKTRKFCLFFKNLWVIHKWAQNHTLRYLAEECFIFKTPHKAALPSTCKSQWLPVVYVQHDTDLLPWHPQPAGALLGDMHPGEGKWDCPEPLTTAVCFMDLQICL